MVPLKNSYSEPEVYFVKSSLNQPVSTFFIIFYFFVNLSHLLVSFAKTFKQFDVLRILLYKLLLMIYGILFTVFTKNEKQKG